MEICKKSFESLKEIRNIYLREPPVWKGAVSWSALTKPQRAAERLGFKFRVKLGSNETFKSNFINLMSIWTIFYLHVDCTNIIWWNSTESRFYKLWPLLPCFTKSKIRLELQIKRMKQNWDCTEVTAQMWHWCFFYTNCCVRRWKTKKENAKWEISHRYRGQKCCCDGSYL